MSSTAESPSSRGDKRRPFRRLAAMMLLPLIAGLVIACDSGTGGSAVTPSPTVAAAPADGRYANVPEGRPRYLDTVVPDPKEVLETKPAGQLPEFLAAASASSREKIAASYAGAVEHYDQYKYIPCYCGCAVYETAHSSLATCYIKERKESGDVTFTDHSLTCDKCQQAAEMTLDGISKGTPLKEVRAGIFKALAYTGIWTETPPVP